MEKMKKQIVRICMLTMLFAGLLRPVCAEAKFEYEYIDGWLDSSLQIGDSNTIPFTLEYDSTVKIEYIGYGHEEESFYSDGKFQLKIVDGAGNVYYSAETDVFYHDVVYTVDLKKGTYYAKISCVESYSYINVNLYSKYIPSYQNPEYSISAEKLKLEKGAKEQLRITCNPTDVKYSVKWKSKNPAVASVSQNGKITAKRRGNTTITATVGKKKFTCAVTVWGRDPTYKEVVKKGRKYAKKHTKFANIKTGSHSRLNGVGILYEDQSHIYSDLYGTLGYLYPSIDIQKKGKTANVKLQIIGKHYLLSYSFGRYGVSDILIYTNNRRISFPLDYGRESSEIGSDNVIKRTVDWRVTFSGNKKVNNKKLDRLITVLKNKNVSVRVKGLGASYFEVTLNESERKNWLNVIKDYKKLLDLY